MQRYEKTSAKQKKICISLLCVELSLSLHIEILIIMKNNPLKENPLLRLTVCLVVGIVIGDYQPLWGVLPFCFVSLVVITLLLWRHANLQSLAISVCFVLLGWLLLQRQYASLKVDWPDGSVRYEVVVLSEPIEKPKTIAVDVMLARDGRKLKCYFYKDARSRALHVGDGLQIQSRIKPIDDRYFDRFKIGRAHV